MTRLHTYPDHLSAINGLVRGNRRLLPLQPLKILHAAPHLADHDHIRPRLPRARPEPERGSPPADQTRASTGDQGPAGRGVEFTGGLGVFVHVDPLDLGVLARPRGLLNRRETAPFGSLQAGRWAYCPVRARDTGLAGAVSCCCCGLRDGCLLVRPSPRCGRGWTWRPPLWPGRGVAQLFHPLRNARIRRIPCRMSGPTRGASRRPALPTSWIRTWSKVTTVDGPRQPLDADRPVGHARRAT